MCKRLIKYIMNLVKDLKDWSFFRLINRNKGQESQISYPDLLAQIRKNLNISALTVTEVTTATDLVAQIADMQSQGLAGTILLKSNLDLTTDTTLDLTGISINLNGFVIKQHGFKFRIKGTGFDIRNGSFDFNSYIPSQNNTANNLGMEILGDGNETINISTILVNGTFDNVTFQNYVGTLNDGNPNIVCSNSAGIWGRLSFFNCLFNSSTGNVDGAIGITNCPFVIKTQETVGTSIFFQNYRSIHHQCGNYSHCIDIQTNGIGAGINFFSDATCRLTSTNIVTDFTTKPTGGLIGVSIIGTIDEIDKLTETTDLTGKYVKVINPVSKTLEKLALDVISTKLQIGTNDIDNLVEYGKGKQYTFNAGTTGYLERVGVIIPVGYENNINIRLEATNNIGADLYWQNESGTNLMNKIPIVWVSNGNGGYYFETNCVSSSNATASPIMVFITNQGVLTNPVTVSVVKIETTNPVNESVETINTVLKDNNENIAVYAVPQSLSILNGNTSYLRITFTIPIQSVNVGDVVMIQFKSVNGANGNASVMYKYGNTSLGTLIWTYNGIYYTSQIIELTVTSLDISSLSEYIFMIQIHNGSGLSADTISLERSIIIKRSLINVSSLKNELKTLESNFNNLNIPNNIKGSFELAWRGYSSMIPVIVKKDGTGNFTTIQAAINSITDASVTKQYDIQIYDDFDVTDLSQLLKIASPTTQNTDANPVEAVALVITRNWIHIRGIGAKKRLSITSPTSLAADSFQHIQTIFAKGNCIINNLNVVVKGGRYAIHQESNGQINVDDYHATTIYNDLTVEHKGNKTADGYTSSWTSTMAQANGTTSGLKMIYNNVKWISDNVTPFYTHTNPNFDEPNELSFINCKIISTQNVNSDNFGAYISDIGSGQKSTITIIGCNFKKFSIGNNIRSNEQSLTLANRWDCGGAYLRGYGNIPFVVNTEKPLVLSFSTIENNVSISVTGGTAKDLIFGEKYAYYDGCVDSKGIVFGEIRIEEPHPSLGTSQIFNLPYRLGNCATTPKTLIITVGGVDYTLVFNLNYMTSNGEDYNYTTVPNVSLNSIIEEINNAFPTVFSVSKNAILKHYTFDDCVEEGTTTLSVTLNLGKGVVRNYDGGLNSWRLSQVGEIAEGIVGERINAASNGSFSYGSVLIISKTLISASILGIAVNAGYFYKCSSDGGFIATTVKSDSTFIAVDNYTLKSV